MRNTKGINPPRMVEWDGEQRKLKDLAREHNINPRTVATRMDRQNWDLKKALTTPPKQIMPSKKEIADRKQYNTKALILNKLMDTFFAKPKQFEKWVQEEMKSDYGKFYRNCVMPFLPKPSQDRSERQQDRVAARIVFDFHGTKPEPLTFEANTDAKLLEDGRSFGEK